MHNQDDDAKLRETADDYPLLVARLSERWRVIVCRDGVQWIVQRRDAGKAPGTGWRATGYCLTRVALLRLCGGVGSRIDPAARARLLSFPEQIARAAGRGPSQVVASNDAEPIGKRAGAALDADADAYLTPQPGAGRLNLGRSA